MLIIAGILYVAFGILAFFGVPGGHESEHHTYAHNLTHIILGLTLLVITWRFRAPVRQVLCFVFAMIYCVIGLYGTFAGKHAMLKIVPGLVEFHAGDYMVHLATAFFFFALTMIRRSDRAGSV
ncbi:MAG TPA: hypothetical protein VK633_04080 [Verrucomicrobiae bacterium]|nr:hypothetical protein [Verrucomicrobiae bacterium]